MRGAKTTAGRRYGGLTADEREQARLERLLDAGLEAIGAGGYAATTIPKVSAAAGVSTSNFYDHFASKEDLLVAVYDRVIAEVAPELVRAMESARPTVREQTIAGVRAFTAPFLADERKARLNFIEVVGVSERMEAHRRQVLHGFAGLIADAAARATDSGSWEPRLTPMALVGATQESLVDYFSSPPAERPEFDAVVAELVRIYCAVLESPRANRRGEIA